MNEYTVEVEVELIGVDEAQKKIDELVENLEKAKTLADELALIELEIKIKED